MKILIGHNYYQIPGGEDAVFRSERELLKSSGEDVFVYERHNSEINGLSLPQQIRHLWHLGRSPGTYREIRALITKYQPDVAHFHNIFFMITPAAYAACKDEGVPVVQSQHNFRLVCSNALFYRDNDVCEDCLDKSLWEGVKHSCYRDSFFLTALIARMLKRHWEEGN